ncbi:hypothetical protein Ae201684P_021041 [Aphanomyces euteiches]|nr:hypothetical protein Ae201684P_021041 [Aphanomyces euteiches]
MHRFRLLQEDIADTGDDVEMQQLTEDSKQCILNSRHLEIYVEQCFLEAYKNAPNRQGRTALHLACDENLVCSHESALRVLLDVFGCDIHIQDNMGKLPIDLLHHRKHRPGSPVENRERELSNRRARHARWQNHFSKKKLEKDNALRSDFEDNLLQFLPRQNETGDIDFEHIKECATVVSTTAGWREYKDPQSHNIVYEHIPSGRMQLNVPREVQLAHEQRKQWYFRKKSARLLEKQGAWTMHKHAQKQKVFFFNSETGQYQWTKPPHIDGWLNIPSSIKRTMDAGTDVGDDDDESDHDEEERREAINEVSQKLLRTFDEWEEHQDAVTGGRVYFNTQTQQLTREKPQAVLKEELKRQAYILMIKSANFMDQIGDWDKYVDPNTEHCFIYNRITGEGRHETEYDEAILQMEAAQRSNQESASQLPRRLSPEELSKQNDHAHWLQVLRRARRKETLKTFLKKKEIDEETRRLNQLNEALLTKIHLDFATSTMGYRDARIATEQRALFKARALGLFISEKINSPTTTASNEAMEFAEWLRNVEVENAEIEDKESNPNLNSRRRVARLVENATWRMDADYCLCFWGCRLWCSIGLQKNDHEHDECRRRIMICRLGCPIFHEALEWQQPHAEKIELDWHEVYECKSRLVQCPRECGAWIQNDQLPHHMDYMCIKRPVPDLYCRVGCGKIFHGATNLILALEQERTWHELEECPNRIVSCMWPGCQEEMMAKDRKLHRKNHLCASGIVTFKTNGSFEYVVPKDCKYIKVQAWGAGGGSGVLHGYKFGHGGGGAFAEAICPVHPGETLYIVVGEGGQGGIYGEINPSETSDGLPLVSQVGQAFGGLPGGGSGHSSNNGWACGGGGGYTSLCRKGPFGIVTILIAAGGGGGGCRDGLGGGDDQDIDATIKRDVRNGGMGTPTSGGVAGEVSIPHPNFKGTSGQMYQGGHGAEFGGGGGGGYYGGGGGGFSPGIVGGGGGGSSYVDRTLLENMHVETALKRIPGGRERHPPAQKDGGISGEGGLGSLRDVCPGNNGCLRLALPGFFSNMDFDTEEDATRDEQIKYLI